MRLEKADGAWPSILLLGAPGMCASSCELGERTAGLTTTRTYFFWSDDASGSPVFLLNAATPSFLGFNLLAPVLGREAAARGLCPGPVEHSNTARLWSVQTCWCASPVQLVIIKHSLPGMTRGAMISRRRGSNHAREQTVPFRRRRKMDRAKDELQSAETVQAIVRLGDKIASPTPCPVPLRVRAAFLAHFCSHSRTRALLKDVPARSGHRGSLPPSLFPAR